MILKLARAGDSRAHHAIIHPIAQTTARREQALLKFPNIRRRIFIFGPRAPIIPLKRVDFRRHGRIDMKQQRRDDPRAGNDRAIAMNSADTRCARRANIERERDIIGRTRRDLVIACIRENGNDADRVCAANHESMIARVRAYKFIVAPVLRMAIPMKISARECRALLEIDHREYVSDARGRAIIVVCRHCNDEIGHGRSANG
ncbi:MAG: hypothetical protein M0R66_05450 [Candidatus Omnitrophica bacterium]|nr:hypothetical protein [Candidatus Omnitrophota bacterium]